MDPGLDWACGWRMIRGSPGPEIDVVSRIELGYSYELGSGRTRIRVMTRPRKRLGMVMTAFIYAGNTDRLYIYIFVIPPGHVSISTTNQCYIYQ